MSTIVTRAGKGSALTHNEVDANFTNLNTDKVEDLSDLSITASAAELNIMDGVTATAAELNKTDDSVAAVSGYVSGMRTYIAEAGGADSTPFDMDSNVTENTFESIGPTGSGATNIWADMDVIPAGARIAILKVNLNMIPSGVDVVGNMNFYTRMNGDATVVGATTLQCEMSVLTDDQTGGAVGTSFTFPDVMVPLSTSRIFDATWGATNDGSRSAHIYLKGFIV